MRQISRYTEHHQCVGSGLVGHDRSSGLSASVLAESHSAKGSQYELEPLGRRFDADGNPGGKALPILFAEGIGRPRRLQSAVSAYRIPANEIEPVVLREIVGLLRDANRLTDGLGLVQSTPEVI